MFFNFRFRKRKFSNGIEFYFIPKHWWSANDHPRIEKLNWNRNRNRRILNRRKNRSCQNHRNKWNDWKKNFRCSVQKFWEPENEWVISSGCKKFQNLLSENINELSSPFSRKYQNNQRSNEIGIKSKATKIVIFLLK